MSNRRRQVLTGLVGALVVALGASGCVHGKKLSETSSTSSSSTIPFAQDATATTLAGVSSLETTVIRLEEVGQTEDPVAIVARAGWPHLTVASRNGRLRQLSVDYEFDQDGNVRNVRYRVETWNMLDIGRQVDQGEGLRAITYSSDGRKLYVSYVSTDAALVVDQYVMNDGDVDTSSRREMLRVEAPDGVRRGGAMTFGRDGFLYVGVGVPDGNPGAAQDPASLYGKVLRLDPEGALGDAAYAIPPGNPYAAGGGAGEIWMSGVRDPRGLTFDDMTGDLYLTDRLEGLESLIFLPRSQAQAGRGENLGFPDAQNTVGPLVQISPPGHCDLRQGAVYRGTLVPGLLGAYVFGDGCASNVDGLVVQNRVVNDQRSIGAALPPGTLAGFGTDNDGEVWVFAGSGQIYRLLPL